jgi:small subunit ribosomal protein S1
VQTSREADAEALLNPQPVGAVTSSSSSSTTSTSTSSSSSSAAPARAAEEPAGTLATDEALAALREKLAGGKS